MLNQVVVSGSVFLYIFKQLCHHIKLVIPRKNHCLFAYIISILIFLDLYLQVHIFMQYLKQ